MFFYCIKVNNSNRDNKAGYSIAKNFGEKLKIS